MKSICRAETANANKEMFQGLQPKGTIRIDGLGGNILTKDISREGNSELTYYGLGQAEGHTLDACPTLHHRF